MVRDATAHQGNPCITFVQRTTQTDYVEVVSGSGCSSYVGRIGGRQRLTMHPNCGVGNGAHEFLHALGFLHEQSRADRDNYVTVNFQNIQPGREGNFAKRTSLFTYENTPYDFGSLMHYSRRAFSKNGQDTITPLQPGVTIGQRSSLSTYDINAIRSLYGCSGVQEITTLFPPTTNYVNE